jgi:hypothetical protein
MKISCEVIRDLLPLYADDVCSDESKELVREHLDECLPCSVLLEEMKSGTVCRANASDEEAQANSFKRFKKKMACKTLRRALIVVCSALLVLSALFFWSYPIQYTEGLLDVHVAVDTVIDCVFQDGNYYRSHVMTRTLTENPLHLFIIRRRFGRTIFIRRNMKMNLSAFFRKWDRHRFSYKSRRD